MKRSFALISSLMLVACGSLPLPGSGPASDPVFAALTQQGQPTMQVGVLSKLSGGPVVREVVRGDLETWLSADGGSLTLQRGFLVGTRGLGGDMLGSDVSQSVLAVEAGQNRRVTRFHTFLDGENRAVRRAYVCDIENRGMRDVPFGQQIVKTRLMAEDCASQDQTFLNLYWIDQSGQIVQSRQWSGDFSGILIFRIVP